MTILQIDYPDELLLLSDLTREQLEHLARETLLVRLYAMGTISSGKAANVLGISRRAFLDLLGAHQVSEFDEALDIEQEYQHAAAARYQ